MPLQAVVFDFDGLVADTETPEFQGWQAAFRDHGAELEPLQWANCVGAGPGVWNVEEHLKQLNPQADLAQARATAMRVRAEGLARLQLRPGVLQLLHHLTEHQIPLAVASSSRSEWVLQHLQDFQLRHFFQAVWTRDLVPQPKPAPDLYLAACQSLQTDPRACVALEDSHNGLAAAKAAHMAAVAVPNPVTIHFDLSAADLLLPTLESLDLPQLQNLARQNLLKTQKP